MTDGWTTDQLARIGEAEELEIAAYDTEGVLRRFTPVWVVTVNGRVYVRTWHRRRTGWFGLAVASGRARVRVPGVEADVAVADLGAGPDDPAIATAYRAKYARYGSRSVERMVSATDTTLGLRPM